MRKDGHPRLSETYDVHGTPQRLRQIKWNANSTADFQTQGAGDDSVGSTGANLDVGRHGSDSQSSSDGDQFCKKNDDKCTAKAGVTHYPSQSEVHDGAKDCEDGWCKDTFEGAEFF